MPRRPEIGNVQLYPNRPLLKRDRNGYVLKFYCPILGKRVRKNCGTRDRKEARRIQRECRERLLNGRYVESDGAITEARLIELQPREPDAITPMDAEAGMSWQECYNRFREHRKIRMRERSLDHVCSRLHLAERILRRHRRRLGLPEELPVKQVCRLSVLEFLQERLLEGDECRYKLRSPNTVNSTMAGVMCFIRYCHKHGWVDSVPPLEKIESDEVMKGRPITEEEFQRMLDATPEVVGPQAVASWQFALRVLWESGLRVGDLMDLHWDQEGHIRPKWSANSGQHPTLLIPSTQKNRRVQEIPLLPGLQALLEAVPESERKGWIVSPVPLSPRLKRGALRPDKKDLKQLAKGYSNVAIARMCGVSETAVRKWLDQAGITDASRQAKLKSEIPLAIVRRLRQLPVSPPPTTKERLSKERVGLVISQIGEAAGIVVVEQNVRKGKRTKYASAHDLRRGCALRLINAGISAETLTVVMRHGDFATTIKHYGAVRSAQAAALELRSRLQIESENRALVGGLVGGPVTPSKLTEEEVSKLKSLLKAL
jgi:integrase